MDLQQHGGNAWLSCDQGAQVLESLRSEPELVQLTDMGNVEACVGGHVEVEVVEGLPDPVKVLAWGHDGVLLQLRKASSNQQWSLLEYSLPVKNYCVHALSVSPRGAKQLAAYLALQQMFPAFRNQGAMAKVKKAEQLARSEVSHAESDFRRAALVKRPPAPLAPAASKC